MATDRPHWPDLVEHDTVGPMLMRGVAPAYVTDGAQGWRPWPRCLSTPMKGDDPSMCSEPSKIVRQPKIAPTKTRTNDRNVT
jgi:hypothetical protein